MELPLQRIEEGGIMAKDKISLSDHNRLITEVKEAYTDYMKAKERAAKAEECEVMPNCPECNGEGAVECGPDATSLAHNPTQNVFNRKCVTCKGKGYV